MKMFTENAQANKAKVEQAFAVQKQKQWEDSKLEELEAFRENHPDVKVIPQEVMKLVAKGESLEGAFAIARVKKVLQEKAELEKKYKELENANKVLKQNNKNARSKMPSSQSTAKKDSDLEWDFD
ncbi:MAG: hypothetical protein IKB62_00525 [Oscillospiraceae bacterium]|nr:hypothetical protein [Oscillospiraceae bacterium]